jgi:NMD protein affecting ribosome stability and mRNA decay
MARERSKTHPAAHTPRPARRIHEEGPDKLPELAACPECHASYRNGRWTWKLAPADAYSHICPACERIASDYPAGVIQLEGDFVATHREELMGLLRNIEERERAEHPLKRIMATTDEAKGFSVTVTDGKLAQSFGQALHHAYEGQLEQPGTSAPENLVRVHWTRNA